MTSWVKAGLIGGMLQMVFPFSILLVYLLPSGIVFLLSVCLCGFFFLTYPVPGILAARWMPAPREMGPVAIDAGCAGLLATALDGLVTLLGFWILAAGDLTERDIQYLMPGSSGILLQAGIGLFSHILIGVVFSVAGGLVYAGIAKD